MSAKIANLCRRRITHLLGVVALVAIIFILRQGFIFIQISDGISRYNDPMRVRGVHPEMSHFYQNTGQNTFTCIFSKEVIVYERINDDYCDCMDGSDEPGTNACPVGNFYCDFQGKSKKFPKSIPTGFVNDGICDCCDGSDEWKRKTAHLGLSKARAQQHRLAPFCPNIC